MNRASTLNKILIIEKTSILELFLRDNLPNQKYDFKTEINLDAALLKMVRWQPDLLITSIDVGNISGFDFCLVLKMMPEFAGLPVILTSSRKDKDLYEKAAEAGADYYITKDSKALLNIMKLIDQLFGDQVEVAGRRKEPIENILVVDDSVTMRKIIKNILEGIGIKSVMEAPNGQEGLNILENHRIDMVISDWAMPVMNGLEMVERIKMKPDFKQIPIIMVSAEADTALEDAMQMGIDGYLRKPFNALKMKELIDRFAVTA